jgi:hypothetical protein
MSYFIAISGTAAESLAPARGRLVPCSGAQMYFRNLAEHIAGAYGGPVYLWDDGESDTSDDIVCEACDEIQLHGKPAPEAAFGLMLSQCEASRSTMHVWWPSSIENAGRLSSLPVVASAAEAIRLFSSQASIGKPIGLVLHPNYAFEWTAGTGFGVF